MLLSVLLLVSTTALLAVLRASPLTSLPQRCDLYLRQLTASGAMPLLTDNISDSERLVLRRCQPAMLDRWTPVATYGDGNCAVSCCVDGGLWHSTAPYAVASSDLLGSWTASVNLRH